jgi:hypothetical protein
LIFVLKDNSVPLAGVAVKPVCAAGSTWDGAKCVGAAMTGNLDVTDCTILLNNSTCNTTLTWQTYNPEVTPSKVTTEPPFNTTVASGNNSPASPLTYYPVEYGGRAFYLYNNNKKLDQAKATAACDLGLVWNGAKCISSGLPAGTLTASDCTIPSGGSSCNTTLLWNTVNPTGISEVTTPENITVATGNSGTTTYPVEFGSRNFYLYHPVENLLSQDTADATCAPYTSWNGTICVSNIQPDLIAGPLSYMVVPKSTSFTIPATIKNQGGASTGNSFSNIFQFASGPDGTGTLSVVSADSDPMSALAAGASDTATYLHPGYSVANETHSVRACADNNTSWVGTIPESIEFNNCSGFKNILVVDFTVDGKCDATHYDCVQGVPGDQVDYGDHWNWTCFGSPLGVGSNDYCTEPQDHCSSLVQDGDETGVDCGGADCPACPKKPWWKEL